MSELRTIIFDLDDTLIETTPVYDAVIERFAAEITALFPRVSIEQARELQDEIDIRGAEAMGFGKERFPWSLAESYRVLAARAAVPPDPKVEERFMMLGYSVFDRAPDLVEGARELLDDLKGRFELLLYTLGVPEVQRVKVEHHGLHLVFDDVHIVPRKSAEVLDTVLAGRAPAGVMVVGDSLRGEIAPALQLGCRAVHIRRTNGWKYHHAQVHGPYETIDRLVDLRRCLGLPANRLRGSA
jgi:putative hydrolase of the HAD superfamily